MGKFAVPAEYSERRGASPMTEKGVRRGKENLRRSPIIGGRTVEKLSY